MRGIQAFFPPARKEQDVPDNMRCDAFSGGAALCRHDVISPLEKIVKQPYLVKFGVSARVRDPAETWRPLKH